MDTKIKDLGKVIVELMESFSTDQERNAIVDYVNENYLKDCNKKSNKT